MTFAVVMALLPKPPPFPYEPSDAILHILAFVVLTLLGAAAYPKARLLWLGTALSGVGAAIEFAQMIPTLNRDAQLSDWLADTGAVISMLIVIALIRHLRGRFQTEPSVEDRQRPHGSGYGLPPHETGFTDGVGRTT
ncbi:MAG: hypothetical protein ACT4N8_09185 [Sphingosinicella sp.]